MQKVQIGQLTAGMLSRNFKEFAKSFVANGEAYSFMNTVKGTSTYWKRFLFEVLEMVNSFTNIFYDIVMCQFGLL